MTFYKGLLDKLGLNSTRLDMGKFKGAAEPLTCERDEPAAARESGTGGRRFLRRPGGRLVHDRHLKDYQAKTYVDQGLFTAADARKAGLIDDGALQRPAGRTKSSGNRAKTSISYREYKTKKIDPDFSGFGGMMKLMEVLMGEKPATDAGKKPKIAVVYAVGPIMEGKSNSDVFGSSSDGRRHDRSRPCGRREPTPKSRPSCCGSTAPAARPRPAT